MPTIAGPCRALFAAAAIAVLASGPLHAQEIAPSHLEAARAALAAVRTTDQFDQILPAAGQALKEQMIQKDPNLEPTIVSIVDQKTIEIAKRRSDLENEAARAYARAFTEAELREIATFYGSPTGIKLLDQGSNVTREVVQAAEIWQRGIARDLAQSVATEFEKQAPASAAPASVTGEPAGAPVAGDPVTAPAE